MGRELQYKRHRLLKFSALAYDGVVAALALWVATNLVEGHAAFSLHHTKAIEVVYIFAFGATAAFACFTQRLHRGIWRYTSFSECISIIRATALTLMIFVPAAFVVTRADLLPRSATIIAGLAMIVLIAAPRVAARALADRSLPAPFAAWGVYGNSNAVPILLVGQVARAEAFLRTLRKWTNAPYHVVGILTDEHSWHGRTVQGVGVMGGLGAVETALDFLRQRKIEPQRLVIADDDITNEQVFGLLDVATQNGLTLGRLPRLLDVDGGKSENGSTIRPVSLADILGRPQVNFDQQKLKAFVANKRVLISGAGGSIGSELVRQVSDLGAAEIVLLDNSEFNLYAIDHELGDRHPTLMRYAVLCDIRDRDSLRAQFHERRPEIVFHAAALKHVPMVELNPIEGVRTNVLGTQNIADACNEFGVTATVVISTDKAVNPHNVMGATKRCAEAYCQALDAEHGKTRFVSVRFGNVLGSTGSVVPLFQSQLSAGGPITVTHPGITRYFMTIPEAVSLVLQASTLAVSDLTPRGCVYVLDMGKPIKIDDLARKMIRLAGKEPDRDIKIVYTGLRPGEKLYEEIVHDQETLDRTPVERVMMVSPRTSELAILRSHFTAIARAAADLNQTRVLGLLNVIVPEFHAEPHIEAAQATAHPKAVHEAAVREAVVKSRDQVIRMLPQRTRPVPNDKGSRNPAWGTDSPA